MKKITSVIDYLQIIQNIKVNYNVFFRGHSDRKYILEPGIYRKKDGKSLVQFEDKIYRDVISQSPDDFVGKNTLETLALMQHYEAPTRILDLSENALVALFFSCIDNRDKDGQVIMFDIPDESVCHYNSDRVTILSNIAKCDKTFELSSALLSFYRNDKDKLEAKKLAYTTKEYSIGFNNNDDIPLFFKNKRNYLKKILKSVDYDTKDFPKTLHTLKKDYEKKYKTLDDLESKIFTNKLIDLFIDVLNVQIDENIRDTNGKYFGKLLHHIKEDKSYFDSIIDPRDIASVYAVKPKLDNARIVRQHGAFLLFGVKEVFYQSGNKYKPMVELNKSWIVNDIGDQELVIDKNFKSQILQELNSLGLNQATLFPEVDKVASFVRRKYQDKL